MRKRDIVKQHELFYVDNGKIEKKKTNKFAVFLFPFLFIRLFDDLMLQKRFWLRVYCTFCVHNLKDS